MSEIDVWGLSMRLRCCLLGLIVVIGTGAPSRGQTVPVPGTIRAEGVPSVPAEVRDALNRYQNVRSASFHGWGARGSGMYITTRFGDVPQVHWVQEPGGARTQLTFGSERVGTVEPRPRRDQFLFAMDEGGAENNQFFLQDKAGGEPRRITDGKSRNMAPRWSPSGDLLAWSSNARNGRDMAAPGDPHFVRRFKDVSGQWSVADWSPDETRVAAVEYVSINEASIHIIDIATGKTESIRPRAADHKSEPISYGAPRWSPDGRSLYYLTDQGGEFRRLVHHHLASGHIETLTDNISWDVEEFDLSDDGNLIAWVINEAGVDRIRVGRTRGAGLDGSWPLLDLPRGAVSGLNFRPNTHQIGFSLSTADSSEDAYSRDLDDRNARAPIRWTTSETGGLDTRAFGEPTLIEYSSFDGRKIPAFVYRPSERRFSGPRPVLIDIHGGPEGQFRPSFLGRLNYLVSELGIVLIFPNVRGSSGYGKTYLKLDNGMKREDAVKDIGALFDWIGGQADLDKSRVGVIGGSYGGFMSLAVQTTYNDRIKAGIDIVGISNFVTFLQNTQGYRRDLRRAEYGDEREPAMRSFLERVSPLARAHMIHTPILVVQGQNDPRVPITEAAQMVAAVKKNGVPLWYVVGTNEGHGFAKKVNQDYLQAVEVVFLRRYLLGERDDEKHGR
jgi:dipeptidyl aminopeptidase/acylaminoacyl peptidase